MAECQAPGLESNLWTRASESHHEAASPTLLILNMWIPGVLSFPGLFYQGLAAWKSEKLWSP